jgi:hypothetical protein
MISVPPKRGPGRWLVPLTVLLTVAAGIGMGLLVSWVLWPVEYVDVAPHSLMPSHREEYIVLIGMSYAYDRDLGLAQTRLAALGDLTTMGAEVVTLAEKYAVQGGSVKQVRALTELAYALGFRRAALAAYLPDAVQTATWTPWPVSTPTFTPAPTSTPTPTPTSTPTSTPDASPTLLTTPPSDRVTQTPTPRLTGMPTPTRTPRPTSTPTVTSTPQPRFEVIERRRTCESPGGQLMVTVWDAEGQPRSNVELLIRWDDGDERFFTGLKPEMGLGYADFAMEKGKSYELVVVGMESDVARDILADMCVDEGYLSSWRVVFRLNR